MKRFYISMLFSLCLLNKAKGQIDAGLFRYPDVSKTQIVFSYANDLWIIPKTGGTAVKLSSPAGIESWPKFSPDGKTIAFSGNYDGNYDIYAIATTGGIPRRLTEHGGYDRMVNWQPGGDSILFASRRESGKARFNQFYTVAVTGGPAEKLPLGYAEYGSYSNDGKQLALTFESQLGRNWKRYRGGNNGRIHLFNVATHESENISGDPDGGDELPMWKNEFIYFLSDRGAEKRMNLWRYTLATKSFQQLTHFTDYDLHYPSMGPDDIVFEAGGKLYLFDLTTQQEKPVSVNVITDDAALKSKSVSAEKYVQHLSISPDGNRVLAEARGDIFSLPAEDGYIKNLTQSSGVAERYPAWSPDGKTIAYFSDQSGEYELWVADPEKPNSAKKLTSYGPGFRYNLFWSPDSKKLAFIDKAMRIKIYEISTGKTFEVDHALIWSHGPLENFKCSWSSDSRWLAYHRDLENSHNAVFIYDFTAKTKTAVTSGYYNCSNPVFDPEGKYLYVITNQNFEPNYSDLDNTFIYANSSKIAAISLQKTTPSLLFTKNDTVKISLESEIPPAKDAEKPAKNKAKDAAKTEPSKKETTKPVLVDVDGMEARMVLLPIAAGNYGTLAAVKDKIIYIKYPNTGSGDGEASLKYFDTEKREEKTILDNANAYELSADGKKILAIRGGTVAVIDPSEGQKMDKPIRLSEMRIMVEPAKEWKQIFMDAWRMERDYFYDSTMHGVDWNLVKTRYLKMLDGAITREDVDYIIGEMIGELNASHTYHGGGDMENTKSDGIGYLGVNWEADGKYYRIKKIIRGAPWDIESQSPFDESGAAIKEGNYILAVNGIPVTTEMEPYAAFQGLAGKTVELTYNTTAAWAGAKTAVVKTLEDEYRLRNLAWIEENRKTVEAATNGTVGYIYVPSTGTDGQSELVRQFSAQWTKKALIIDERFNDGGQIPDRFVELLNRTPLAFWAIRDGSTWTWPPVAHFGPQVMLINGWSGSGGDAFPDYFRKRGLGPLIGNRTWGGLIGISGVPDLIDGGSITVPTFRMYNPDGTWFKEGHGVDPDILVNEDLSQMAKGIDPQLQKGISEALKLIKEKEYRMPPTPAFEKRN